MLAKQCPIRVNVSGVVWYLPNTPEDDHLYKNTARKKFCHLHRL